MKKYLVKIALFFVIIFVVDFVFGKVCGYLRDHTKGGFSGNVHYICEQCDEDIIMMGSSRMRHHYVPQIFEDSLGMSCYNTGIDGNGIILSYGFLEMILERYTPKMIIYDVTAYDMYSDDNIKYLATLKGYFHKKGIPEIFKDVDTHEIWKMKSQLYRYNSDLLGLLGDNIHPLQKFDKGYKPSTSIMDYEPEVPDTSHRKEIDLLKIQYLHKFISLTRQHNIKLIFTLSPTYFGDMLIHDNDPIRSICQIEKVPLIDFYSDKMLSENKNYWGDPVHLNDTGAKYFSRKVVELIRSY